MGELQPRKIPPSLEAIYEQARNNAGKSVEVNAADNNVLPRLLDKTKKQLTVSAARLIEEERWGVIGDDGPDYLDEHRSDYGDAVLHIWELLGKPTNAEDFERKLLEYARQIEENPNNKDFSERLPVIAFRQGQDMRMRESNDHLHDENGMFIPLWERKLPQIQPQILRDEGGMVRLRITKMQSHLLNSYRDRASRLNQDAAA